MDSPVTNHEELLFIKKNEDGEYTRRQVRSLIFHFLYAMDEHDYDVSLGSLIDSFNRGFDQDVPAGSEISHITQEIIAQRDDLDAQLEKYLENWKLSRLGLCTKLILRMGLWELLNTDVPAEVTINESVDLSKGFSEQDAYKFVNGVLDRIAVELGKKTPEADKPKKEDKKSRKKESAPIVVDESDLESIDESLIASPSAKASPFAKASVFAKATPDKPEDEAPDKSEDTSVDDELVDAGTPEAADSAAVEVALEVTADDSASEDSEPTAESDELVDTSEDSASDDSASDEPVVETEEITTEASASENSEPAAETVDVTVESPTSEDSVKADSE